MQAVGFDVLHNINTHNEMSRRGLAILARHGGVVFGYVQVRRQGQYGGAQRSLAAALVEDGFGASLLRQINNHRRDGVCRPTLVRVTTMQL